jgi:signal transduction histidine kinase
MTNQEKPILPKNALLNELPSHLQDSLNADAKRIHEIMCIAAIIIFPIFAIFDIYTIPEKTYWPLTITRLSITAIIAIWLFIQKKYNTPERYLAYFTFLSISWFCCYACVAGGSEFLFQHNIAYCTVFLAASLFIFWHWKHSVVVVISSIVVYSLLVLNADSITMKQSLLDGGSVLLTIMAVHPVIIAYRYNAYKREFFLGAALKQSNEELITINQNLESIVNMRTHSLEETNKDLKAAISELDQFLYSSHHDLKGPIARLKGLVQLAFRDMKNEKASQYQTTFLSTVKDMEYLMEKLNKINTFYHHTLQKEIIPVKDFLTEILFEFQHENDTMKPELKLNGTEYLMADKALLKPVLQSVVENSLRYKKEDGNHRLIISLSHEKGADIITVWDNGAGIPEAVMPNIFNMFYRGNERSQGHGLGLYLSRKAVDKMKGKLQVESKEGEYTEVKITIFQEQDILD